MRKLYCERKILEFGDAEVQIQGKPDGSVKKKAGTMKRDAVQENAHILVIEFQNSNFFITNQRLLGKVYSERKISEFGDSEL